jgi:hypothetical protein
MGQVLPFIRREAAFDPEATAILITAYQTTIQRFGDRRQPTALREIAAPGSLRSPQRRTQSGTALRCCLDDNPAHAKRRLRDEIRECTSSGRASALPFSRPHL